MRKIVCGLIGPVCSANARTVWNRMFADAGIDAFFDFYRTVTREDLELRLSEMFLLERRGYIVAEEFQTLVLPLLDRFDTDAEREGKVDTVINEGGVLIGYFFGADDAKRVRAWFS